LEYGERRMTAFHGPFVVACLLLLIAGIAKLHRPAGTAGALGGLGLPGGAVAARALGAVEVALGPAALLTGAAPLGLAVAALYAAFAVVVLVGRRDARLADCGCFGVSSTPPSLLHAVVDAVLAAAAVAATVDGLPSAADVVDAQPWRGLPYLAAALVATYLVRVVVTELAAPPVRGSHA